MKKVTIFLLIKLSFFNAICSGFNRPENSNQHLFPKKKQSSVLVRLCSYNIRGESLLDRQYGNFWNIRKYKIQYLLQQYQPDIIGFQGVSACCMQDILNLFPGYLSVAFDTNDQKDKDVVLLVCSSRFDILDSSFFWLNQDPLEPNIPLSISWGTRKSRIVVHVVLQDKQTGKRVVVFCTHFDSSGIEARVKSAQTITQLYPQIALDLPVIIMGDFNFMMNSSFPELIQKTEDAYACFAQTGGLFDVRDIVQSKHFGPDGSWIGWPYDKYAAPAGVIEERFDHIFVKQCSVMSEGVLQIKVNSACNSLLVSFDNGFDEVLYPSDHLPVVADIIVQ